MLFQVRYRAVAKLNNLRLVDRLEFSKLFCNYVSRYLTTTARLLKNLRLVVRNMWK